MDRLSSGYGTDAFASAKLKFSNPNTFLTQHIQEMMEGAEGERKERKEKKARAAKRKAARSTPDALGSNKEKARVTVIKKKKRGGLKDMIGVDEEDDVVAAFKKIDANGDGALSPEELQVSHGLQLLALSLWRTPAAAVS